jgi:hypothetical protein
MSIKDPTIHFFSQSCLTKFNQTLDVLDNVSIGLGSTLVSISSFVSLSPDFAHCNWVLVAGGPLRRMRCSERRSLFEVETE